MTKNFNLLAYNIMFCSVTTNKKNYFPNQNLLQGLYYIIRLIELSIINCHRIIENV